MNNAENFTPHKLTRRDVVSGIGFLSLVGGVFQLSRASKDENRVREIDDVKRKVVEAVAMAGRNGSVPPTYAEDIETELREEHQISGDFTTARENAGKDISLKRDTGYGGIAVGTAALVGVGVVDIYKNVFSAIDEERANSTDADHEDEGEII